MDFQIIGAALALGLVTGIHCIGMCGPIAISLPLKETSKFSKVSSAILYNLGRAITYAIMGMVFGFFGQSFAMAGFQKWVGIVMGTVMILYVIFPAIFKNNFSIEKFGYKYTAPLRSRLAKLFGKRSYSSLFVIGILNGLLPCGPVYGALFAAIATGSVFYGTIFMFLFGIGTIPIMLTLSLIGNKISNSLRTKLAKLIPIFIVILGVLFILRGLGLGIMFISPPDKMLKPHKKGMMMHKKTSSLNINEKTYYFNTKNLI
ncbi:MAG: sulfite exporter TauE/SafE family protein [Chlorobi bacterium]|nr:sulfite exporter TauE/SafE family protein [Chlorobiota bacterium]